MENAKCRQLEYSMENMFLIIWRITCQVLGGLTKTIF